MENGMIRESAPFLSGLRLEGKLVRACAGGEALWRSGLPREGRQWRHALARWGAAACQVAAAMGGGEALSLLDRTLAARPCIRVRDLALSGGDLAALGLSGPGIGLAQPGAAGAGAGPPGGQQSGDAAAISGGDGTYLNSALDTMRAR